MKRVLFSISALLILVGFGFTGFKYFGKDHKPGFHFKTAVVEKKNMKKTILATGTVKPMVGAEVKVGARVSGLVKRLFVKVGDKVKKGDIIAIIEHDDIKAKVEQSKAFLNAEKARLKAIENENPKEIIIHQAKVEQAKANLETEKAKLKAIEEETPKEIKKLQAEMDAVYSKLKLAESNFERDKSLLAKGIVSPEKYDTSLKELEVLKAELRSKNENLVYTKTKFESNLNLAQTRIVQAKAGYDELAANLDYIKIKFSNDRKIARTKVVQADANLKEIEIDLSYATIISPIKGIIASISTQEGETVAAELNSPTFVNIIDMDRLQVNAFVDETDIGYVNKDQDAQFVIDTYPGEIFEGVVEDIYPKAVIQENVVNYEVIIGIPSFAMSKLRPEMTTSVTIVIGKRKGVLAVPKGAVKRKGNHSFVLVKKNKQNGSSRESRTEKRDVEIGWRDSGFIEIKEGLKLGDKVVLADSSSAGFDYAKAIGKRGR